MEFDPKILLSFGSIAVEKANINKTTAQEIKQPLY